MKHDARTKVCSNSNPLPLALLGNTTRYTSGARVVFPATATATAVVGSGADLLLQRCAPRHVAKNCGAITCDGSLATAATLSTWLRPVDSMRNSSSSEAGPAEPRAEDDDGTARPAWPLLWWMFFSWSSKLVAGAAKLEDDRRM